ncbi:phage terminase small subunit [Sphingobium sp.]|uniref:phage terminase small subunit n=1 Tax=Sphingobium sp. TaxID=1912891 RepID=UPI0035C76422
MSLARRHRDRILAAKTVASAPEGGADASPAVATLPAAGAANSSPEARAAAQIGLRLTHDLRRLKEIRSIDLKIAAKREMLPEYRDWVAGILAADAGVGTGLAAEVVPTVMVWLIDTGAYADALDLAPFILKHKVAMPSRYQRDAATIIVEEIATGALKAQGAGASFPLEILVRASRLTAALDIHDEVRAKLLKAIGIEQLTICEGLVVEDSDEALNATIATLREAQRLNDRIGVKDRIKRAEKLLAAVAAAKTAAPSNNEQGGAAA